MRVLLAALIFASSSIVYAQCSDVRLTGKVHFRKSRLYISVAEGTNSARLFSLAKDVEMKAASFAEQFVEAEALISSDGKEILQLENLKRTVPDPLNAATHFKIVSKKACP